MIRSRWALQIVIAFSLFVGVLALPACDPLCLYGHICSGGGSPPPADSPGTFSFYSEVTFTDSPDYPPFCLQSQDTGCIFEVNSSFGQLMTGWSLNQGLTDGLINGAYTTPTTASQIIADNSNLILVSTHGGTFGSAFTLCLRDCSGSTVGGTIGLGSADIPSKWNGPAWLIADACEVTVPNVGWETIFGGNLHGVLGYNQDNHGLDESGLNTLANTIVGYSKATDAWVNANAATNTTSQFLSMLIPSANTGDYIEARGGPHYGQDHDTNPVYYSCCISGTMATSTIGRLSSTIIYSLTPEAMNEGSWYNKYGGGNVPSLITHPTANEDLYRNEYVIVDHYLASGGILVGMTATGTAKGLSMSDAYGAATSWISNNGGIPGDAVLTFAGASTISPIPGSAIQGGPYPGVRQYVFIERHRTSGLINDKIQVNVDDDGSLTYECTENDPPAHNKCYYTTPWNPSPHVSTYARLWRTLGSAVGTITRQRYTITRSIGMATASGSGLCGSGMADANSVASPCDTYTNSSTNVTYSLDPSSGDILSVNEKL